MPSAALNHDYSTIQWDEEDIHFPPDLGANVGIKVTRVRGKRRYLSKEEDGYSLMCLTCTYPKESPTISEKADKATGWFDGQEIFTGKMVGKEGSFVMRTSGTIGNGELKGKWTVVTDSGRAGLEGITGGGWFEVKFTAWWTREVPREVPRSPATSPLLGQLVLPTGSPSPPSKAGVLPASGGKSSGLFSGISGITGGNKAQAQAQAQAQAHAHEARHNPPVEWSSLDERRGILSVRRERGGASIEV